ncbi:MAG TPA: DEAD/DEAH box helicase family protein [Sedimentisphaerales bacterium]|nr:DEAD/DEAH box helicase family protein [Sedimentisphaerales bacterium]
MANETEFRNTAAWTLRPYQEAAVSAGLDALNTRKNGILVLPTGSGKSLVLSEIAQRAGGRSVILQPTKEILEQNLAKMKCYGIRDIGIYSASMNKKTIGKVTFATIGTIIKRKDAFKSFDRVIVDECHRVNSKGGQYEEFISHLGLPTIGLTATPYRLRSYRDQMGEPVAESRIITRTRPRIFSRIAHVTQLPELFEAGYLSPIHYSLCADYDSRQIKSNTTGQGYDDASLERYNQQKSIPDKIVAEVVKESSKHILAFTPFVSESQAVVEKLKALGVSCRTVTATTSKDDRETVIRRFRSGEIRCVVNVGVLTTGFDYPELDCIILGRVTKSVALFYQMVGRGVRPHPGKKVCNVIDLTDNVNRFGRLETFELYDRNGNGMWRLKSDVGPLTGVDVTTGTELESVKARPIPSNDETLVVPFGKHKDQPISEVPTGYLRWAVENFDNSQWKSAFRLEIQKRQQEKATV